MLRALVALASLGVVAVIIHWFTVPNSSGPTLLKNLGNDISDYIQFLMGK